jgi:hypothetical protein
MATLAYERGAFSKKQTLQGKHTQDLSEIFDSYLQILRIDPRIQGLLPLIV